MGIVRGAQASIAAELRKVFSVFPKKSPAPDKAARRQQLQRLSEQQFGVIGDASDAHDASFRQRQQQLARYAREHLDTLKLPATESLR